MTTGELPDVIGLAVSVARELLAEAGWQVKEVKATPACAADEGHGRVVRIRRLEDNLVSLIYVVPPPPVE